MFRAAPFLLALALAAAAARAQDKIALKPSYEEGETYVVRQTNSVTLAGSVQGQDFKVEQSGVKEYTDKVVAVKDGRPVKIERTYSTYENKSVQTMGAMPPQEKEEKNLAVGKTVTLVEKDGKVEIEGDAAATLKKDDRSIANGADALLPPGPVAVGDTWEVSKENLDRLFGDDGPEQASATCKLESVAGGTAKIVVKMAVSEQTPGGKMEATLEGPLLFGTASGRVQSMRLQGTAKMASPMATFKGPIEMVGTFTSK